MKKPGIFLLSIFIILFLSCEIGLGSSVDTDAPTLEITNPPADAVIRDTFAISGVWKDDGSISSVSVEMVRLDNNKKVSFAGTFAEPLKKGESGSWRVVINPKEASLLDGTYEALVAINDNGGHTTTMARTFTIDNTPPVLLLSRPSIKDGQNGFDSYGRSFTLEGKAADDNDVSHIEVNIFQNEDSTVPMKTIGLDNIPLTIEQNVAVYEANKANDYAEIYGHTNASGVIETIGETEQRYCTITIYDGAERYPADGSAQSSEDKRGNSTNAYYMNSDITALLRGVYKITDLYHMMNNNYGTDATRAATAESVKNLLNGYKVTKSKFSINPANNPKFILSSGAVLEEGKDLDDVDYQFTAGNRYVEVEIRPGLDGYPIDPDSIGIYLLKCDENGVIENDAEKIWLINTGSEYHKTQDEADAAGSELASGYGIYTVSGSTYKFKTSKMLDKANYGVNTGCYYLVQVEGYDSQGEGSGSIISDGIFAFNLISSGEKIELSAHGVPEYLSTEEAAWAVPGHESFSVTLNWTSGDGPFYLYRNTEAGEVLAATVTEPTNGAWEASESFNYSQLKALAPGAAFPEKIAYCLKNGSGDIISTTARINLKYDSDKPSITNIQFLNSYLKESTNTYYVRNQSDNKCTISGIATDDTGIESVALEINDLSIAPVSTGRFKFENIDFSGLTASNLTATIVSTDIAGNQETQDLDIIFDTTTPHGLHAVDASSKDLYFRIGNADNDDVTPVDAKDKAVGGKYGNGTFGNATTIQIRGNFSDAEEGGTEGSGVAMIYYKVYPTEFLLSTNPATAATQIKNKINEVITEPTGKFAPLATPETKRVFYNVGRKLNSNDEPVVPEEPDDEQIFEGSTQFTNTTNSKGYYKYYKTVETTYNETVTGFKEGNNYLIIVAEDKVGNKAIDSVLVNLNGTDTTFVNYSLNVDTTPPSDITTLSTNGVKYSNGSENLSLWGTISDKTSTKDAQGNMIAAGLKSFVLSRDGVDTKVNASLREVRTQEDEEGNPADSAELQALAATDPTLRIWEADISSLMPDESKTVSISATATDAAGTGNSTPGIVATITIDKKAPTVVFADESPKDADSSTEGIQINGTISINGTADDTNGIEELIGLYYKTYTGNTAPVAPADNTVIASEGTDGWLPVAAQKSGTSNWKFTNIDTSKLDGTNSIEDGTKLCFTVAVKDKAGNIGYSSACPVIVDQDTDRPVIHLNSLPLTYKDEHDQTQIMTSENPVWFNRSELTGTVDDDDGAVEYVKVIAKDSTEAEPSESEWEAASNTYRNGIWSYTIPSNGYKKIYFQIKDKNGTVFTSNIESTSAATYGPKIQDTDYCKFGYKGADSTADDVLYVKVDTDDPVLDKMYYFASPVLVENLETAIPDYDEDTQTPGWKLAEASTISDKFGGTNKYLYIKCKAHDTNGISSLAMKFGNLEPLAGKTVEISQAPGNENYKELITCFNIKDDVNPLASGITKLEINIKDNAAANIGSSGISKYYEAVVDNTEPEISFSNYTKGTQVYGSSAVTLRGTTSDSNKVEKVEYVLSKTGTAAPENGWIEITDETKPTYTSKLGWQIVFDDKISDPDSSSYHAELLKKALFSLYNVAEGDQAAYDTTQKIYIWMRATDELGNCGTNIIEAGEGFYLDVIPNGDKPAIDITYPSNGASVGGTIRITGTTNIQDTSASVKYVYLQIDPNYGSVKDQNNNPVFNESGWADELQTLMNAKGVTSYQIQDLTGVVVEGTSTNLGTEIGKGIPSLGNSKTNWYLIINGNKELNVDEYNRKIAIKVFAVSSTGKITESNVIACEIDPKAPTFGQTEGGTLRFVQYTDNTFSTESASRTFENGVYLTGQWYLVGSVEDDSGIRLITLDDHNIVWTTGTGDAETIHDDNSGMATKLDSSPNATSKFKNYMFRIPVGDTTPDSFGKKDYEISVTDGSDSQTGNSLKFTIYYDNKAPEFEAKKGNGIDLVDGGRIYQSNGSYTVHGTFKEASVGNNNQSGFKRIAMFYTRERTVEGVKGLYLIDSMIDSGDEGTSNFIKLATIGNGGALTYEANISKTNGLYWRKINGTLENSNELSLTDNTYITNKTIRAGGLCMIDNVMYRISRITGTKLILEGTIADFSTAKPVYFAYAQIIDNLSQESGKTVVYADNDVITNGDGDCMIEGVQFSGGEYNWNASIDSSNMLDGNVTMSFVGYDAAGNFTEQSWNQKISNNAPRIAGVSFGTDIDLDGKVSSSEMTETYAGAFTGQINVHDGNTYNGQDADGNWITEYTVPETLTVKGAVKVKPMIVGGNTALGWQYTYKTQDEETESTGVTQYADVGHSNDGSVRTSDLSINISLKNFLAINIGEGSQDLKFTIWDETDGSTLGNEASGSAKAEITLPVNIIIADNEAPRAHLTPFHWMSAAENSIYQNNPANGHIELESDWAASGSLNTDNATLDGDAKVSGMITFDGEATDNVIVQTIKAIVPGYNGGNAFVIAQRDASATETKGWISSVTLNPGTENEEHVNHMYYKEGEEVKANATLTGDSAVDWVFELLSDSYDADGKNTIVFKFHFNTEKVAAKAATNVAFKFIAMDKGSPKLQGGNVIYANEKSSTPGDVSTTSDDPTGCYRVDIVPYITRVITGLSSLKKNNPSVYARTSTGHYAVSAAEVLNIEGFNVSGATLKFVTADSTVTSTYSANAGGEGVAGYAIPATAKSGNLSVQVSGIESLNNSNRNEAKGAYNQTVDLTKNPAGIKSVYDNYYNRQPNGDNNNLLTDDVVLDIWEIDPTAVRPKVGGITQPVMAIDPVTEHIGFAFINGTAFFSMPYGTNSKNVTPNSYEYWIGGLDEWNSISLAYDINGYSYGTAAGGDLNTSKNGVDIFRFTTSRWNGKGTLSTEGYKDLNNQFGLEYIGEREFFYDDSQSAWADFTNFSKSRIKSPSLATVATTTDKSKATVYLAYYDSINDEIRFNWGEIKNATGTSDDAGNDAQGMFGTHYGTARSSLPYSISGTSLIAGQTNNKAISTTPTYSSSLVTTTTGKPVFGGEYVSIAALAGQGTNDDAVVAVWWDGTHHKMLYSYNKTPKSIQKGKYTQADTKWSTPEQLFPAEVGEFCKVTADSNNGVHIAAYDSTNGDIWYAYLSNYASPSTAKVGYLDSNGFVGSELNIDVAIENGKPVPYISYYASNAAKPKIARWIGENLTSVSSVAGADDELFTSNWEISYVPTTSKLIIDHINVGVWKNASGVIKNSKTGTKDFHAGTGATVNSYGTVWGNGTSNPVLGYATKSGSLGYIETAQMK